MAAPGLQSYFDFPLLVGGDGRLSLTDVDDHVRDMIEQVLFTAPGERVNRPDFGCGLHTLVFEPDSQALAAATEVLVRSSLQRWLSDVVDVEKVDVQAIDSKLLVEIEYVRLLDGARFQQQIVAGEVGRTAS